MAALSRPTEANYTIHEEVTVDTEDREDHTFCGIMFPVKAKDVLPVHQVLITEISVRGRLGPLTVWVTKDDDAEDAVSNASSPSTVAASSASPASSMETHGYNLRSNSRSTQSALSSSLRRGTSGRAVANSQISMRPRHWTKIYSRTHPQSFSSYTALDLSSNPIRLRPGQVRGVYIHSTLEGDEAIVYDNRHQEITHDDGFISVLPGRAHVSTMPFGQTPIWGWGNAWRDDREFVGRISYGAVFRLWNPSEHCVFGDKFRGLTRTLFMCQRRWESPFSFLPDDCIFFILNMCRWDWAEDNVEAMKEKARFRRRAEARHHRRLLLEQEERERAEAAAAAASVSAVAEEHEDEDVKMGAVSSESLAEAISSSTELMADNEDEEDDDSDESQSGETHHGDMHDSEEDDSDAYVSDDGYGYDEYRNMSMSTFRYHDLDNEDDSEDERRREDSRREEEQRRSYLRR
mmetsp:Transcript_48101/g.145278  ORF Transcript_48101/g.145278 Transcript_48101/m.145278 type:complete len:462 (-) Transcript_48101:471-1856(-)